MEIPGTGYCESVDNSHNTLSKPSVMQGSMEPNPLDLWNRQRSISDGKVQKTKKKLR